MHIYPSIVKQKNLEGKRVLVRSSLNIPLVDNVPQDIMRLRLSLRTIQWLSDQKAKVIVTGHLSGDGKSFENISNIMQSYVAHSFVPEVTGSKVKSAIKAMKDGDILLLENLRLDPREEACELSLAEDLAKLADLYVFDAFDVSHRRHSSVSTLPTLLKSYSGIQFLDEMEVLVKLVKPVHPSIFVAGGAKTNTKMPLLRKMVDIYGKVFLGGVMANTFLSKKYEVGRSKIDENSDITDMVDHPKIILPIDVVVEHSLRGMSTLSVDNLSEGDKIVDIGPQTIEMLKAHLSKAKTVLWNGPLGFYEDGFVNGSVQFAKSVASIEDVYSIAGGGDTLACLKASGVISGWSFVSTGGGAMISFLSTERLMLPETLD